MRQEPKLYDDPRNADRRLEQLGLRREHIERAVFISEYHRDQCTDNDAPGAQGWIAYSRCVRAFREIMKALGWEKSNDQNRAITVSPNGKVAVAVVAGNEGTGKADETPDVQTPKGKATKRAVDPNQGNLFDLSEPIFNVSPIHGFSETQSWFLLRRRTEDSVFIEFSLPASMVDGHVEWWLERIVLGEYPYESQFSIDEDFDSEPIDIPIQRRRQQ